MNIRIQMTGDISELTTLLNTLMINHNQEEKPVKTANVKTANTITAKKKGRPKKTVVPVQQDDPEIEELRGKIFGEDENI
jgi:plastocyanin domain-containing protein